MSCGCKGFPQVTNYGSLVCLMCGVEDLSQMWMTDTTFVPRGALQCTGTYTRQKRFRKYVHRTAMHQSATCVPNETWEYLLKRGPYSGPRDIVARLKRLRRSNMKKCYDCLPYLTSVLCPHLQVPHLDETDKNDAMFLFRKLDYEYTRGGAPRVILVRPRVHPPTHRAGRPVALHQQNPVPETAGRI